LELTPGPEKEPPLGVAPDKKMEPLFSQSKRLLTGILKETVGTGFTETVALSISEMPDALVTVTI